MNVFNFRNRIIEDYSGYVSSFISIAQSRLREFVDRCFKSGSLWPDPLIQLNPTFKPGKTVAELVQEGVLDPGCNQIFRREKTTAVGSGDDLLFHRHQEDAIRKAKEGRNYVLTTRGVVSEKDAVYRPPNWATVLMAAARKDVLAVGLSPRRKNGRQPNTQVAVLHPDTMAAVKTYDFGFKFYDLAVGPHGSTVALAGYRQVVEFDLDQ